MKIELKKLGNVSMYLFASDDQESCENNFIFTKTQCKTENVNYSTKKN